MSHTRRISEGTAGERESLEKLQRSWDAEAMVGECGMHFPTSDEYGPGLNVSDQYPSGELKRLDQIFNY